MAVVGAVPDMAQRGIEMHMCAIHAEFDPDSAQWKWYSMIIWAVGPIPDLGQAMPISTHAFRALYHPRLCDKELRVLQQ